MKHLIAAAISLALAGCASTPYPQAKIAHSTPTATRAPATPNETVKHRWFDRFMKHHRWFHQ